MENQNPAATNLEEEVKQLRKENNQLVELVEELKQMVECPVCLLLPKNRGPIPVCSNGHFVCTTCRCEERSTNILFLLTSITTAAHLYFSGTD